MKRIMKRAGIIALCGGVLATWKIAHGAAPDLVVQLQPTQGNAATGTVRLRQADGKVMIEAQVFGLTPGLHGFHIHEKGDCSAPDASSAGGHFNPHGAAHGASHHEVHHAGDFGNLSANADGQATLQVQVPAHELTLEAGKPHGALGRALIVHADPDDGKSQPTGNAGKRVACGVIAAPAANAAYSY